MQAIATSFMKASDTDLFLCISRYFSEKLFFEDVLLEKLFLELSENSQEKTCARVSFLIKLQACEISKKTFFTEYLRATVFVLKM